MTLIALIVLFGMSAEARGKEAGAATFEAGELVHVSSAQARFDRLAAGGQASAQGFSPAERPSMLSAIEIQGLLDPLDDLLKNQRLVVVADGELGTELVVLSGCGDSVSGAVDSEAQVWLGDALMYGGASQVVTSGW